MLALAIAIRVRAPPVAPWKQSKTATVASATPGRAFMLSVHLPGLYPRGEIAACANDNKGQPRCVNNVVENRPNSWSSISAVGSSRSFVRPGPGIGGLEPGRGCQDSIRFAKDR